ncbi:MAG: hypothetical protein K9N35_12480 [Candidatus Marinimicrobia bacterium]|nr:hypothetical protein [Candidatus Neomarinimicrobiota bacterium]
MRNVACIILIFSVCWAQEVHAQNPDNNTGKVIIPYQDDIYVSLDDKSIEDYPNTRLKKSIISRNKNWVVDKLPLGEYEIRVDKTYHEPVTERFTLTQSQPVKEVDLIEGMILLSANVSLSSNADGRGRFIGDKSGKFSLRQGESTLVKVPYGHYDLTAQSPGFFPVQQKVTIFEKNPPPISIEFIPYDKSGAVRRSMLIPGLGQFYSKQKSKGFVFGMISGLGVGLLVNSFLEYDSEVQRYDTLSEEYLAASTLESMTEYGSQLNSSKKRISELQTQFLASAATVILTYTWNIFDIAVLFPYD